MSVPPKTDQDVPPPHRRTLPHFPVNEQGMRELEIWLNDRFGGKGFIRYVFKNIGKWLYIKTTGSAPRTNNYGVMFDDTGGGILLKSGNNVDVDAVASNILLSSSELNVLGEGADATTHNFGNPDFLFKIDNDAVPSIIFAFGDNVGTGGHPEIGLIGNDWQGYMDGGEEVVYGQGGNFSRYTGGGNVNLVSTENTRPNSGEIVLRTNGTSSDAAVAMGDITLDTQNLGGGTGGDVNVNIGKDGFLNILANGRTLTINDHLGNPLVTYTG